MSLLWLIKYLKMTDDNQKDISASTEINSNKEDDIQEKTEEVKDKEENSQQQQSNDKDAENLSAGRQVEELTNTLARAMADLQNYKRRTEEDKSKFVKFANAEMLKILLPIIDNFNRSINHLPESLKDDEWAKGIVQIHDEFIKTLEKIGVKKIKTVGEKLNPNLHEGLIAGEGEKDIIIEEFEPGYTLNGDVIKVAKVKVGDGTK